MRFGALVVLLWSSLLFAIPKKAGYRLEANSSGFAHLAYFGMSQEYWEYGVAFGYGASTQFSRFAVAGAGLGFQGTELRAYHNQAIRLDAPLRLKYRALPYLSGQLSYERIVKQDVGLEASGKSDFGKENDIFLYLGIGYEITIKNRVCLYLEGKMRFILTGRDKTGFYQSAPFTENGRNYTLDKVDPTLGSKVFWSAGINFVF